MLSVTSINGCATGFGHTSHHAQPKMPAICVGAMEVKFCADGEWGGAVMVDVKLCRANAIGIGNRTYVPYINAYRICKVCR